MEDGTCLSVLQTPHVYVSSYLCNFVQRTLIEPKTHNYTLGLHDPTSEETCEIISDLKVIQGRPIIVPRGITANFIIRHGRETLFYGLDSGPPS
jgi:hypothetical protein